MNLKYNKAKRKLKRYNQLHILNLIDRVDGNEKNKLIEQVNSIKWKECMFALQKTKKETKQKDIQPIESLKKSYLCNEEKNKYNEIGEKVIKTNKYGVLILAGGQGTRLGYDGPKGTYKVNIGKEKSLFEIYFDEIKKYDSLYNIHIPVYIMTSKENERQTQEYFMDNNFFEKKDDIVFFSQEQMPMFDVNRKVIIDENNKIKLASNGHGNVFNSMRNKKVIKDLSKRDIEWLLVTGIDNILMKPVDTLPLGIIVDSNADSIGKSVLKKASNEKMGVFCKINNRPAVLEYSEISEELATKQDNHGNLIYGEAHLLWNIYKVKALKKIFGKKVEYHLAFKKTKYKDYNGKLITPDEPNAYKLESFIFDYFKFFKDMKIIQVSRSEEFAPIKNANGTDSPKTAIQLYMNYKKSKDIS